MVDGSREMFNVLVAYTSGVLIKEITLFLENFNREKLLSNKF